MRTLPILAGMAVVMLLSVPGSSHASSAGLLRSNCSPVWLGKTKMVFNQRQPDGRWDVMLGDRACSHSRPLLRHHDGHRGASDVTADGRYVLLETDYGTPRGAAWAERGKGYANDLELFDRRTGRHTRLTTGRKGTIWARLHPSGTKVAWAQLVKTQFEADLWHNLLGVWELHVADITAGGKLSAERNWRHPGGDGFLEAYGWLGNRIMFASDIGVEQTNRWLGRWFSAQLWTLPDTLPAGAAPTRVSRPFTTRTWWGASKAQNAYHEFMHLPLAGAFNKPGPWILASIAWDTQPFNGMDLWRMRPDGSGRQRLTFFNGRPDGGKAAQVSGFPAPRYTVVGSVTTDPLNPRRLLLSVTPDPNAKEIQAWELDL